jgi:hypothetical protein
VARSWFHGITRATTVIPLPGSIYRLKKRGGVGKVYSHIQRELFQACTGYPHQIGKGPICATYAYGSKWRGKINGWCFKGLIAEALRAMGHRHTWLCGECLSESGRSKWAFPFGKARWNFLCRPLLVHVIWGQTFFGLLHWFDGPDELFLHLFLFLRGVVYFVPNFHFFISFIFPFTLLSWVTIRMWKL